MERARERVVRSKVPARAREGEKSMIRSVCMAAAVLSLTAIMPAEGRSRAPIDANGNLSALIAQYSATYGVPASLIRRVIARESGGNARVVSRGNYGLMQIKLGTARSLGYTGGAAGLLDADTNMRYAVKYLAGAWKLSGGSEARAVHHYASGYYYAAKRRGIAQQSYALADAGDVFYRGRRRLGDVALGGGRAASLVATSLMSPSDPNFH
jgi:soluble lytic murein transglycosylase-like protein